MSVLLSGCNTDSQQRIAKLEQQVQELSNENRLQPRVIEKKDVEARNPYQLPLQLKVGDRVEGEVSFTPSDGRLYGEVYDPYGNVLFQTPRIDLGAGRQIVQRFVSSPWRFAFIAATDGEYKLEITCRPSRVVKEQGNPQPVAHLRIVHYTGN